MWRGKNEVNVISRAALIVTTLSTVTCFLHTFQTGHIFAEVR